MIITLKHKYTQEEHTIQTEGNDPDKPVTPTITGGSIDTLRSELSESYGHYGHTIDLESTTNLDLQAAVHALPSFEAVSIKPAIAPNPLPENSLS